MELRLNRLIIIFLIILSLFHCKYKTLPSLSKVKIPNELNFENGVCNSGNKNENFLEKVFGKEENENRVEELFFVKSFHCTTENKKFAYMEFSIANLNFSVENIKNEINDDSYIGRANFCRILVYTLQDSNASGKEFTDMQNSFKSLFDLIKDTTYCKLSYEERVKRKLEEQ